MTSGDGAARVRDAERRGGAAADLRAAPHTQGTTGSCDRCTPHGRGIVYKSRASPETKNNSPASSSSSAAASSASSSLSTTRDDHLIVSPSLHRCRSGRRRCCRRASRRRASWSRTPRPCSSEGGVTPGRAEGLWLASLGKAGSQGLLGPCAFQAKSAGYYPCCCGL
jgi:hypothetical protein